MSKKDRPLHFFVEPVVTYVGFEVLTAVVMKNTVFWDITPCSRMKVRAASRATSFHSCILLGSLLDPEDGGDVILRNLAGGILYVALNLPVPVAPSGECWKCSLECHDNVSSCLY
jgi:hypothetical protein